MRRRLFAWIVTLLGVLTCQGEARAQTETPNIVLIIADDIGWPYHGFLSSPQTLDTNQGPLPVQEIVRTPNLDTLASQGTTFRRGYSTASICQPSLLTFLSAQGLDAIEWAARRSELEAVPQIGSIPFRRESMYLQTLPKELARRGYASWEGGKMWYGTFADAGFTHGLATSVGGLFQSIGDRFGREGWDAAKCGSTAAPGSSCPAMEPLAEFLDETAGRPFFVWFAPMLPHVPYDAAQAYRQPYEALGLRPHFVDYLANVTWLDELVGELLEELRARGIEDDTLVIYATDNGWGLGFQFQAGSGKGKGTLYDLGFRTPVVFRWPGRVPAGVVHDDLVSTSDIPATILDYVFAEGTPLGSRGVSLLDRIEGGAPLERSEIITHHIGSALVNDDWRYLQFADGREQLFRIDVDPFEQTDVAGQHPNLLDAFAARVDADRARYETPPESIEIVGRLVDQDTHEPMEGAALRLVGGPASLISVADSGGWFRFGPLDPSFTYQLRGRRPLRSHFEAHPTGNSFRRVTPLTSAGVFNSLAGNRTSTPTADYSASLSGTLHAADTGSPIAGSVITVLGKAATDRVMARVTTGSDGSFRVENLGVPGRYRLIASSARTHRPVSIRSIELDVPGEAVGFDLHAEPK